MRAVSSNFRTMSVSAVLNRLICLLAAGLVALSPSASAVTDSPLASNFDAGPQTLSLTFENDLFGDTDQQYTNGIRVGWMSSDLKLLSAAKGVPLWLRTLVERLTAFEAHLEDGAARQFNVGFGIGQLMFTPEDTQSRNLVVNDRPYAGWLYGSLTFVSKSRNVADTLELQGGVVGPASLAEQAQKFVHDVRDLAEPKGWDNQLDNEPGFLMYYERKWRLLRGKWFRTLDYDVISHAGLALGNVADYVAVGGEARVGWHVPRDFGTSLIRPGGDADSPTMIDSSDARSRPLGVYAFAAAGGRLVGRDIFLDGNSFRKSHDVSKKYAVGDLVIGGSVVYRALKLSYAQVFRSKEFDGQRISPNFGSLSLSVSF